MKKPTAWLVRARARARKLKRRVTALVLALADPATPWYARLCGTLVVAYALSPIDLIPDFIPVLGLLDDLVLLPLGIGLTLRMIPRPVFLAALRKANRDEAAGTGRYRWIGLAVIITVWLVVLGLVVRLLWR